MVVVAGDPKWEGAVARERGRELRGTAEVDVHRAHRQRDREDGRCVAAGASEADRDQVGERNFRLAPAGHGDRRDRERDVEDGHHDERERDRARQVDLGPVKVSR